MFNKPGVFGRNEPITRRDAQPVSGNSNNAPQTAAPMSDKSSATVKTSSQTNVQGGTQNAASSASDAALTLTPGGAADGKDNKDASTTATPAAKSGPASERISEARLIVGPDVKLKGAEILDCDTLVVEGRVEATMDSRVLRIAENGSFSGKVSIDIAEVHGTFDGELTARSQLIIHSTGRVSGKIHFGTLVVDEGGELCGEINVLSEKAPAGSRSGSDAFSAASPGST